MMDIKRHYGGLTTRFIYSLMKDNKVLMWYCGGRGDLYWSLVSEENNLNDSFIIAKEDNELIYNVFDSIYKTILNSNDDDYDETFSGPAYCEDKVLDNFHNYDNYNFVDKEKNTIRYVSDETQDGLENELLIHKEDDKYRLELIYKKEQGNKHEVRFAADSCRYGEFIYVFHNAYEDLGEACKLCDRKKASEYFENQAAKSL